MKSTKDDIEKIKEAWIDKFELPNEIVIGREIEISQQIGGKYILGKIIDYGNDKNGCCFISITLNKQFRGSKKHKIFIENISQNRNWDFGTDKCSIRFLTK